MGVETKLNANTAPDVSVIEVHEGHDCFLSAMTSELDHLDAEPGWAHDQLRYVIQLR